MALSDTKLRKISGKEYDGPSEIPDGEGLSARISPKGYITFQYRYRFDGRLHRLKIGVYPDTSLKDAREKLSYYREVLARGENPAVTKIMDSEAMTNKVTVSRLIDLWMDSPESESLVKREYWRRAIDRHIIPMVGKMTVDDMTIVHWRPVFDKIRKGGAPVMAGSILSRMKQIINYGVRNGFVSSNVLLPLSVNDVGKAPKVKSRYLSDSEIGLYWNSVGQTKIAYQNQLFVRLMLLTGCRGVELRMAVKRDFDFDNKVWNVPELSSKTRVAFRRGLSDLSIEILREAFELYPEFNQVFPPAAERKDRPMANSVLISLAGQIGKVMGVDDWSMHDLRRTCKTKMAELGVAPHVSEKILGHKLTGMLAVYDRHEYIAEQIEAAEKWAAEILKCSAK